MKKVVGIVLACLLAGSVSAQGHRHQVHTGYGAFSTSNFLDAFARVLASGASLMHYTSKNSSYSGIFQAGYKYEVARRLDLGATYSYGTGKSDAFYGGKYAGQFKNQYHTISADADYRYVSWGRWALYASVGIGATIYRQQYEPENTDKERDSDRIVHFNFQASPLAIKYGNRIGLFAEIGAGYRGLVQGGAFVRF